MDNTPHPACINEEQLVAICDFQRTRRGGPGGQHRNKVDSAIVVTHRQSGISASASERRSQHENRSVALRRLRLNLAVQVRRSRNGGPSKLWKSRCQSGRISVSAQHEDFACLLAEALDQIHQDDLQMAVAADSMGCSTSQLVKFIKQHPPAFARLNSDRGSREMPPLK